MNKQWRIYMDKRDESGKVWWSVDNGSIHEEIKVGWVNIACHCWTAFNAGNDYNGITAWIALNGIASFENGGVTFMKEDAS